MTKYRNLLTLTLPVILLTACNEYRGIESRHQPVVSRTDYSFDVATTGYGLAPGEDVRLSGWLASMRIGYGDTIAVDDPSAAPGVRSAVAAQAAGYGLLLADTAPVTTGSVAPGTVRVVVSRATARVPGCPDYTYEDGSPNFSGRTSSNYGCGLNSTMAAMVANPVDLVRGQPGASTLDTNVSSRAIDAYRRAVPTGAGGTTVKSEAAGGR